MRFNLYTTASYGSVIATVTTRGGFILYVNGNEMTRFRMEEGATSHTTESTEETETAEAIQMAVAFPMAHIKNQDNLMCLEIHTKTLAATNDFHVAIGFGENTEDMLVDGTASYSHAGYYDSTWDERNFHALDKNINTKFTALGTAIVAGTEPVYVQWHYNGMRHETLNFLRFYAATRGRARRATSTSCLQRRQHVEHAASPGGQLDAGRLGPEPGDPLLQHQALPLLPRAGWTRPPRRASRSARCTWA